MTIRKLTVAAAIAVGIATCSFNTANAACPCDQRPIVTGGACPVEELPVVTGAACPCEQPKAKPRRVPQTALRYGVPPRLDGVFFFYYLSEI